MKVFLSQIKPLLGNIQQNIAIHETEIKKAISKGCELVVFPELSLTGYYLRDLVSDIAFQINSPVLKMFEEYSDEISIILGFVYEDENHNYYNAAAYFEDGMLKHIHKKVYLPIIRCLKNRGILLRGIHLLPLICLVQRRACLYVRMPFI